ncbi:MAG: outer membrane beta-barrel family protein [Muribaculaceae bacterium]|nr:outer membrane beta-barrel family protein [Muribaculaceae bacterium]
MKRSRIILTVSLIAAVFSGRAQENSVNTSVPEAETDTVGRQLQEIVVEGRMQRNIEGGVEYIPDKKAKKFAMDAISLLSIMMIPQLNVTPDNTVKSASGENVKIFIDYVEATETDTSGLRPEDVLRVEVLDYPEDPRFKHSEHVVNFIMRKYEWGGYTKLMASGRLLFDENIWGGLYQKFSYKNWMYDFSASGDGTWNRYVDKRTSETFRDFFFDGTHYDDVSRITSTERKRGRDNNQNASMRVRYNTDRMNIGHTVSFARYAQPASDIYSRVEYTGIPLADTYTTESKNSGSTGGWITGNYWFSLPENNSLQADWTLGFDDIRQNRSYRTGDLGSIDNDNRMKFYYPHLNVTHSKNLGHGNSIGAMIYSSYYIHDTRYCYLEDSRIRSVNSENLLAVNYSQRWEFGLSVNARVGANYIFTRQNGVDHTHHWTPYGTVSLTYSPDSRNSFRLTGAWFENQAYAAEADNVILRQDELIWYKGNPELRNPDKKWMMLTYSLIPSNRLSMYAYALYTNIRHGSVYDFTTVKGYDGVVRTYGDINTEHNIDGGVNLSLNLFNRSLSLMGTGIIRRDISSGMHPMTNTDFLGRFILSWTYRNFFIMAWYNTPETSVFSKMGYRISNPEEYGIRTFYSFGNWKLQLIFSNWFSARKIHKNYSSPHYDYSGWESKTRFAILSVNYTIPYGKPVNRNDEIQSQSAASGGFLE